MSFEKFTRRFWLRATLVLALVFVCAVAFAAQKWDGEIGTEDGIPLITNLGGPMNPDKVIQTEKLWQLGGEEDDEEEQLIGFMNDAIVDGDGNTYLLDNVLSNVVVVAPEGSIQRTIGNEGDGFRNGQQLLFMPNGDLGIWDLMPSQVVTMTKDGTPREMFHASEGKTSSEGMSHIQKIAALGDLIVVGKTAVSFGDGGISQKTSLATYDSDGNIQNTFLSDETKQSGSSVAINIGGDNDFAGNWELCPDGRVIVFREAHEYKMEVFTADGKADKTIRRKYESLKRPAKDIARDKKRAEEMSARFGGMDVMAVDEYFEDISRIYPRENGDVWVGNSQGRDECPANSIGFFDVFDRDGKFTQRIRIEADYDPDNDLFRLRDNMLYVFKEGRNAPARSSSMGGGGSRTVMISMGGNDDEEEDEDEEPAPFKVVCYKLVH